MYGQFDIYSLEQNLPFRKKKTNQNLASDKRRLNTFIQVFIFRLLLSDDNPWQSKVWQSKDTWPLYFEILLSYPSTGGVFLITTKKTDSNRRYCIPKIYQNELDKLGSFFILLIKIDNHSIEWFNIVTFVCFLEL